MPRLGAGEGASYGKRVDLFQEKSSEGFLRHSRIRPLRDGGLLLCCHDAADQATPFTLKEGFLNVEAIDGKDLLYNGELGIQKP